MIDDSTTQQRRKTSRVTPVTFDVKFQQAVLAFPRETRFTAAALATEFDKTEEWVENEMRRACRDGLLNMSAEREANGQFIRWIWTIA